VVFEWLSGRVFSLKVNSYVVRKMTLVVTCKTYTSLFRELCPISLQVAHFFVVNRASLKVRYFVCYEISQLLWQM